MFSTFNTATPREGSNGSTAAGLRDISFDISKSVTQPNEFSLVIKGFLSPGWSGRLATGLAQHRIGIDRGEAEKISTVGWHASFKLKTAPFAKSPQGIDYAALVSTEVPQTGALAPIVLREFVLEPPSRHDGCLYLEIKGVDRLGFLGDLLDYFSMRCLFPVRMSIETVAGSAVDRFWLRGVGGSVPSESIVRAMEQSLRLLVHSNA